MNLLEQETLERLWAQIERHEPDAFRDKDEFIDSYEWQSNKVEPYIPFGICRRYPQRPFSNGNYQFVSLGSDEDKARTIVPVYVVGASS